MAKLKNKHSGIVGLGSYSFMPGEIKEVDPKEVKIYANLNGSIDNFEWVGTEPKEESIPLKRSEPKTEADLNILFGKK